MGLSILAIGVWAWTEKDTFNNLSRLTNIALDPAFVLIVTGMPTSTTPPPRIVTSCQMSEKVEE